MFDIGWSEMAIIMLLALIIIGPKDLPRVARTVGQWVRKGRMLAREFQTSLEDMAKEAELDDVKKEIEKAGMTDLKKTVENTIDPKGDLKKAFDTSNGASGEETVGKVLNGSADAKKEPTSLPKNEATAQPATSPPAAEAKPKPKTAARPKKPSTTAKNAASTAKKPTARKPAAKKPAAPRKRAAKPAASTKSEDKPSSGDGGGAAMAAKSS
ncbi:MAG: Sec-independent protein translocase protein TatB [Pseudomonadota bacterium]